VSTFLFEVRPILTLHSRYEFMRVPNDRLAPSGFTVVPFIMVVFVDFQVLIYDGSNLCSVPRFSRDVVRFLMMRGRSCLWVHRSHLLLSKSCMLYFSTGGPLAKRVHSRSPSRKTTSEKARTAGSRWSPPTECGSVSSLQLTITRTANSLNAVMPR
jgi:hypothetical protein